MLLREYAIKFLSNVSALPAIGMLNSFFPNLNFVFKIQILFQLRLS